MSTVPSSTPWWPVTEECSDYTPPLSQAQTSPRTTANQKCQSEVQQPSATISQLPMGASMPLPNAKWRKWKWTTSTMGSNGSIMKITLQKVWVLCVALMYHGKRDRLLLVHLCSLFLSCSCKSYLQGQTRVDDSGDGSMENQDRLCKVYIFRLIWNEPEEKTQLICMTNYNSIIFKHLKTPKKISLKLRSKKF